MSQDHTHTQTGTFDTAHASKYIAQLCKHFGHKVETSYDATTGMVALPIGPVHLSATDAILRIEVSANDDAGLDRARNVIDSHLKRFAFREDFEHMSWQAA